MNRITTFVLAAAGCAAALASDIPPPRPVDVAALVRQLGNDDFKEREAAERRLSTLKVDEVPPELLAALKSPNLEVRERAARAIKTLRGRIALAPLPRGERFAKRGQIDLYVASTATGNVNAKADDDRLWEPALDIGRAAVKKAELKGDRIPWCPALCQDVAEYKKDRKVWFTRAEETYTKYRWVYPEAIQAPSVAGEEGFRTSVVVSRGPVKTAGSDHSLVLATGDIDCGNYIGSSVVICDGDVRVGGAVSKSLIVARGSISIKGTTQQNTLIAGGAVTIGKPREISNSDEGSRDIVEEKATNPLGYITFFELRRIGLEVNAASGAVKVAAVKAGLPGETAGLKVGDTILDVNGKKPADAESLRRLLRDALAIGDATVKLQRGDKTETVKLSLPE